jgi:hypothetical protein
MANKCGCNNCKCGSAGIPVTDNMGREIFWEDIGRQDDGKQ